MKTIVLLALTLAAAAAAGPGDAPATRTCSRSNRDKTLNSCIRHNIQAFIPHVKNGGMFGLPRLEPYLVPKEAFKLTGPIDIAGITSDFAVYGLSGAVIRDAMADIGDNTLRLDVDILFPNVTFHGMADVTEAQLVAVPFKGRSIMTFSLTDINATWRVEGKRRDGEKHMHIESVTPTYTVGGMKANMHLPDATIPNLERVVNAVLNYYWNIVVEMARPFMQKTLAHHMQSQINTIFQNVPFDHMFPA